MTDSSEKAVEHRDMSTGELAIQASNMLFLLGFIILTAVALIGAITNLTNGNLGNALAFLILGCIVGGITVLLLDHVE